MILEGSLMAALGLTAAGLAISRHRLHRELGEARQELDDAQQESSALERVRAHQDAALQQAQREQAQLEGVAEQLRAQLASLTGELHPLRGSQQQAITLAEKCRRLEERSMKLTERLGTARNQLSVVGTSLKRKEKEQAALTAALAEHRQLIRRLENSGEDLTQAVESLRERARSLELVLSRLGYGHWQDHSDATTAESRRQSIARLEALTGDDLSTVVLASQGGELMLGVGQAQARLAALGAAAGESWPTAEAAAGELIASLSVLTPARGIHISAVGELSLIHI